MMKNLKKLGLFGILALILIAGLYVVSCSGGAPISGSQGASQSGGGTVSERSAPPGLQTTQGVSLKQDMLSATVSWDDMVKADSQLKGRAPREIPFHRDRIEPSTVTPKADNIIEPAQYLSARAPSLQQDFKGTHSSEAGPGFIPPDTMGAAGPNHIVEITNDAVDIYTKSTGARISIVTLQAFWSSLGTGAGQPAEDPFDPKIIYDQYLGRFVAVTMGGATQASSWIMIGVSATADPTGTWYLKAINSTQGNQFWADYPGYGVDSANLYVTANMFKDGVNAADHADIWVIKKDANFTGPGALTVTEIDSPAGALYTLQPAHCFGTSTAEYFSFLASNTAIGIGKVDPSTATWSFLGNVTVNSFSFVAAEAPQPGTSMTVATNDSRMLNSVFRNGSFWTTHEVADATGKTEVAWYQFDPTALTVTQQGRISDTNRWYYFPSIAVNSEGGVAIGFSGSSSTEYVTAFFTGRTASDPVNTMQNVGTLKAGTTSYTQVSGGGSHRFGDYSATCIDPNDDITFWTVQEYPHTDALWGTWWGKLSLVKVGAPTNLSASASTSEQIDLSWTDNADNEEGFRIEMKIGDEGSFSEITTTGANTTTYSAAGLTPDTKYTFRVRAFSGSTNSDYSNEASATTKKPSFNYNPPASLSEGGGGCFIATAAYGSYLDPHVMVLRQFRDNVLLKSRVGRELVGLYYSFSPPVANVIGKSELFKAPVRTLLNPVVWILSLMN